jgi:hypothetical protein
MKPSGLIPTCHVNSIVPSLVELERNSRSAGEKAEFLEVPLYNCLEILKNKVHNNGKNAQTI